MTVKQSAGAAKVEFSDCAVIAAGTSGKVYYAKGSVTAIENTLYGNWTLKDATGTMYVYGTLDEAGAEKNFESLGLAEGDFVEVMGPLSFYNGKPQLKNITVLKIEKGIIKFDENESVVEKDVKTVDIPLTVLDETKWSVAKIYELNSNNEEVPVSWATVGTSSINSGKIYQTINVQDYLENAAPRVAYIRFAAEKVEKVKKVNEETGDEEEVEEKKLAEIVYTLTQVGNVPEISTVATAITADENTWVRIKGIVMGQSKYGVVVADETGAIFCDDITSASIGETVEVSGNVLVNRKFFMLDNCYCEGIPADSEAVYPTPAVVTSELIAGIANRTTNEALQYITFTGRAEADGTKGDIMFTIGSYKLKPHNVHSNIYKEKAIGKDVEVYGYAYQLKDADLRFVITDLKWPAAATE